MTGHNPFTDLARHYLHKESAALDDEERNVLAAIDGSWGFIIAFR